MSSIDELLRHPGVWRARDQGGSSQPPGLPTGFSALDGCLPGGGWPRQGLIELLADSPGIGELSLLMPALAALCGEHARGRLARLGFTTVSTVRAGPGRVWHRHRSRAGRALGSGRLGDGAGVALGILQRGAGLGECDRHVESPTFAARCRAGRLSRRALSPLAGIPSAVPGRVTHHAVRQAGGPGGANPEEPRRTTNQHDAALRQSPVST